VDGVRVRELTAPGAGGVSVLLLEGGGALDLLEGWCGRRLAVGEHCVVRLRVDGELLDEAVACALSAELAELHLHGSPPLVRRLMARAPSAAVDPEPAGLAARAREALAWAPCEAAARVLVDQAEGAWTGELAGLLEFDDRALSARLAELRVEGEALRTLFEPARVLLAGPANAGKSTLFNLLVGGERAITSDEAGTTRDLLREPARLGAWPLVVFDGAGAREVEGAGTAALVEGRGQALVERVARAVDVVLWLAPPGSEAPPAPAGVPQVPLPSRGDLAPEDAERLRPREDPAAALTRIQAVLSEVLGWRAEPWSPGCPVLFDAEARAWAAERASRAPEALRAALAEDLEVERTAGVPSLMGP